MMRPFIIMLNPKTLDIVQCFVEPRGGGDAGFRMSKLGSNECVANCYTDGSERIRVGRREYVRIHSAGNCEGVPADFRPRRANPQEELVGVNPGYKGQGFGFLVYSAAAVGMKGLVSRLTGVYSPGSGPNHNRSRDAEALWRSMVENGLAEEETVDYEGEDETEEREHCESISDRGPDEDGWYITDDEVCASVSAERKVEEEIEVNTLDAATVEEQGFVLWSARGDADVPTPDLVTRLRVQDRAGVDFVVRYLRENYDDPRYVHAFLDRPEIGALIGQQALFGSGGPRHIRVPLPPVSAEARRLVDMFRDAP